MKKTLKQFFAWLNKPRYIEIGTLEDDDAYFEPIIKDLEEPNNHVLENINLTIDYNMAVENIKSQNFDRTMALIKKYIIKNYEKDGLLISKSQLEKEANNLYLSYCKHHIIDNFNNLKPAVLEIFEELKS